jgi:uncharacterized membrane protein
METSRSIDELTRHNVAIIAAMEKQAEDHRTRGERVADIVAAWVGSWTFIIIQSSLLTIWIILNLVGWWKHWDPYPFILLNLALSFQAAYASPIIMISQNRQGRLAERRNHLDLQINLLAEQETTEIIKMLRLLCDHAGVAYKPLPGADVLAEATAPEKIVEQIEGEIEHKQSQDAEAGSLSPAVG